MTPELIPLRNFLTRDITPDELARHLDDLEHECSMALLKEPSGICQGTLDGIYYLHRLRKTLEECGSTSPAFAEATADKPA